MVTWGQLTWIFFPLPIFCLFLLSVPLPKKLERLGTDCVGKIFFAEISVGPIKVALLWLFVLVSIIIFANTTFTLQRGVGETRFLSGDPIWYRKAMKFRAERNFWLSLFNVFLWLLVWEVHCLKKKVVELKDRIDQLEIALLTKKEEAPKNEKSKKDD